MRLIHFLFASSFGLAGTQLRRSATTTLAAPPPAPEDDDSFTGLLQPLSAEGEEGSPSGLHEVAVASLLLRENGTAHRAEANAFGNRTGRAARAFSGP